MSDLVTLLYVSRARPGVTDRTIDTVLERARAHNEADGISGALLAYGGRFLQVLEGPPDKVTACFDRIRSDKRHHEVTMLCCEPTAGRHFGPWAMRHIDVARANDRAVSEFMQRLQLQQSPAQVQLALQLLQHMAEQSGDDAAGAPS